MTEDNNPFKPALAKPADDSILATDPVADDFLAGNDKLSQHTQTTNGIFVDGIKSGSQPSIDNTASKPMHLDQMMDSYQQQAENHNEKVNSQPAEVPFGDLASIQNLAAEVAASNNDTTVSNGELNSISSSTNTDSTGTSSKAKHSLFGRKKKDVTNLAEAASNEASTFGSLLDTTTNLTSNTNTNAADVINFDNVPSEPLTDVNELGQSGQSMDMLTANQEDNNAAVMGNFISNATSDEAATANSISDSLAVAASMADSGTPGINIASTKAKPGQPKQLTISVLTIVFFVMFITATAVAIWLGIENNKHSNELSDANAELQQLRDRASSVSDSTNVTANQFDTLQSRIEELTKDNEAKQKTIDENTATINSLNQEKTSLTDQLAAAQNKLNSDTQVSEKMQSLITTICTIPEIGSASSVCIDAGITPNASPSPAPNDPSFEVR